MQQTVVSLQAFCVTQMGHHVETMCTCLSEVLSQCNIVNFRYFMISHEQFCYFLLVL